MNTRRSESAFDLLTVYWRPIRRCKVPRCSTDQLTHGTTHSSHISGVLPTHVLQELAARVVYSLGLTLLVFAHLFRHFPPLIRCPAKMGILARLSPPDGVPQCSTITFDLWHLLTGSPYRPPSITPVWVGYPLLVGAEFFQYEPVSGMLDRRS